MANKVLIVSICKEKMHELEFVLPIKKFVKNADVVHFLNIDEKSLKEYTHIIISGTSLHDFSYMKHLKNFNWLKSYEGKVLGICAGFQILGLVFGGKIRQSKEIGYFFEKFDEEFLGMEGPNEVYHLHKCTVDFPSSFKIYSKNSKGLAQAVKHKEKDFYGIIFHPEVRNRKLIEDFLDG